MTLIRHLAPLVWLWAAAAPQTPPVRVLVSEATAGGVTTYSYRVINGASQAIVGLEVGYDRHLDTPRLRTFPLGWTAERGLPATSATAPHGWTVRVVMTEESDRVNLAWSSDEGPQWDIAPGTTETGFSIKLASPDAEYRTAPFDITLADATRLTGSLEPDTTAPLQR